MQTTTPPKVSETARRIPMQREKTRSKMTPEFIILIRLLREAVGYYYLLLPWIYEVQLRFIVFRTICLKRTQTHVSQYQCCWLVLLILRLWNSRSNYYNLYLDLLHDSYLVVHTLINNWDFIVVWVWMLNQGNTQALWVPARLAGGEMFERRLPVCKETTSAQCPVPRCPAESSKC